MSDNEVSSDSDDIEQDYLKADEIFDDKVMQDIKEDGDDDDDVQDWGEWEAELAREGGAVGISTQPVSNEQVSGLNDLLIGKLNVKMPGIDDSLSQENVEKQRGGKSKRKKKNRRRARTGKNGMTEIDPIFDDSGEEAKLEVWRVEGFDIEEWDDHVSGQFYRGDCYLVLYTRENEDTRKLMHDIFIWIGTNSTVEKKVIVCTKASELARRLYFGATIHREIPENESELFLECFAQVIETNFIEYEDGGSPPAIRHVDIEEAKQAVPVLLHLKGAWDVRVSVVSASATSLNSGDVFLLYVFSKLFLWIGTSSNYEERANGMRLALEIKSWKAHSGPMSRCNNATLFTELEGTESDEFWEILGGRQPIKTAEEGGSDENASEEVEDQEYPHISDWDFPSLGKPDSETMFWFNGNHDMLLPGDFTSGDIAEELSEISSTRIKNVVMQTMEKLKKAKRRQNKLAQISSDVAGSGDVRVMKVTSRGLVPVPRFLKGVFESDFHHCVLFSYRDRWRKKMMVYFWKSLHAPVLAFMKWEMEYKSFLYNSIWKQTKCIPIMLTVHHGSEPTHFLNLFSEGIVVLKPTQLDYTAVKESKTKSKTKRTNQGKTMLKTRTLSSTNAQMFRVSGFFHH